MGFSEEACNFRFTPALKGAGNSALDFVSTTWRLLNAATNDFLLKVNLISKEIKNIHGLLLFFWYSLIFDFKPENQKLFWVFYLTATGSPPFNFKCCFSMLFI